MLSVIDIFPSTQCFINCILVRYVQESMALIEILCERTSCNSIKKFELLPPVSMLSMSLLNRLVTSKCASTYNYDNVYYNSVRISHFQQSYLLFGWCLCYQVTLPKTDLRGFSFFDPNYDRVSGTLQEDSFLLCHQATKTVVT